MVERRPSNQAFLHAMTDALGDEIAEDGGGHESSLRPSRQSLPTKPVMGKLLMDQMLDRVFGLVQERRVLLWRLSHLRGQSSEPGAKFVFNVIRPGQFCPDLSAQTWQNAYRTTE